METNVVIEVHKEVTQCVCSLKKTKHKSLFSTSWVNSIEHFIYDSFSLKKLILSSGNNLMLIFVVVNKARRVGYVIFDTW